MRRTRTANLVILLALLALGGCGSIAGKPPPGLIAQEKIAARGGLASQASGTCRLFTKAAIQLSLGGQVDSPVPDTLTPGLDRCTWRITGSNLGTPIALVGYRVVQQPTPILRRPTNRGSLKHVEQQVALPLGKGAAWNAANLTLTWPTSHGSLGLEVVLSTRGQKLDSSLVKRDLEALAERTL